MKKIVKYSVYLSPLFILIGCGSATENKGDMEKNALRMDDSIKTIIDSVLKDPGVFTENNAQITNTYIFEYK